MNCEVNPMGKKLEHIPRRVPVNGTFELTVRCNLHCKMCLFRHDDSENPELMAKELTAAEWIDLARQAAEAGTLQLLITGGEPLLRSDFCEIWEGIYRFGFITELYTNATLLTPKIMETLRKYPPNIIGVTIYGSSPEYYQKVCKNGDAFYRMVEGVQMLKTLPSVLNFRTTIIKDNYCDLSAMERLLKEILGIDTPLTNARMVTKAVRGGCANVESCRLSAKDSFTLALKRAEQLYHSKTGTTADRRLRFIELPRKEDNQLTLLGCKAGMSSYAITWDGLLQGCQMLGAFSTNAAALGFQRAWAEFPMQVKLPDQNLQCIQCELNHLCECCYAFRYSETGSLQGVPEYICENTRIVNDALRRKL